MRRHSRQVRGSRNADTGFPAVRHNAPTALRSHIAYAQGLGNAAHPADIRLRHVHAAAVHQIRKLVSCREPFAGGGIHRRFRRQPCHAVEVIHRQRRFNKVHVQLFPIAQRAQRGVRIRPGVLHIHHQREIRPHCRATGGHGFGHFFIRLIQAAVIVRTTEGHLQLGGVKAQLFCPQYPFHQRCFVFVVAFAIGLQRSVRLNGGARVFAHQLIARHAGGFATDIPQGHVDRAHGVDDRAAPAVHTTADIKLFPEALRVERVFADEHFLEAEAHRVRAGRLNTGAGHPRVHIAFADAGDAFIGVHEHNNVILRRGSDILPQIRHEQYAAFDVGDLHRCGFSYHNTALKSRSSQVSKSRSPSPSRSTSSMRSYFSPFGPPISRGSQRSPTFFK